MNQESNWKPISNLPLISYAINGQLESAQEVYDNLLEARTKPHVLDNYTVKRVIQSYAEQLEYAPIYKKQYQMWVQQSGLSTSQKTELRRLQNQTNKWEQLVKDVLKLADELKEGTIEKVLSKSDFELGLEVLKKKNSGQ